jgi:hypothetical protein
MYPFVLSRPSDDSLRPFTSCSLSKEHGELTMMFATQEGGIRKPEPLKNERSGECSKRSMANIGSK